MKKLLIFILVGVILLTLMGCGQTPLDRNTSPDVNKTDMEKLTEGNNTFALDLYQTLKENNGNVFYSPYSISSALAMTYAGARGETEKQMADTLHFTLAQERLHPAFNSVSLALASRGQETEIQDKKGFILKNVNALWSQKNYKFLPAFLDILAENYGAGIRPLDFVRAPEDSRLTINNWVSEQTENRINDLLPQGSITPLTRLVLTNAIYFKANWFYQFSEKMTGDGQFNLLNSSKVTVPMMKQTEHFNYTDGIGYQVVELPYRGQKLSMIVLLPNRGQFSAFENSLDYSKLQKIIGNLQSKRVVLTMPKFEFTSEYKLGQVLAEMGMPIAFSGNADFSGMTEEEELCIDEVIHKAFVAVDENGTEAAAATAVMMVGAAPGEPVEFTMDRPFIFLIRDIETDTILFIGRVLNPLE
ncbi:MAG: serpin family protein [Dehalococcoidales bacterium]|nr:serpin family protein [Dehalococcoidales bacterium]